MNFKIHLLIITVIVAMLYLVRVFVASQSSEPVIIQQAATSQYSISIAHASWGMNCRASFGYAGGGDTMGQVGSDVDFSKIKEDNVLSAMSNLCNDKMSCDIPLNTATLGDDPLPVCNNKILQIEYRCFSIDKLRIAKAATGTISIDCDKQLK